MTFPEPECKLCKGSDSVEQCDGCGRVAPRLKSDQSVHQEASDIAWSIVKADPCPMCGAQPGDSAEACAAGEEPASCSRRKAAISHVKGRKPRSGGRDPRDRPMPRRM